MPGIRCETCKGTGKVITKIAKTDPIGELFKTLIGKDDLKNIFKKASSLYSAVPKLDWID